VEFDLNREKIRKNAAAKNTRSRVYQAAINHAAIAYALHRALTGRGNGTPTSGRSGRKGCIAVRGLPRPVDGRF
jgi:hypothetical protein